MMFNSGVPSLTALPCEQAGVDIASAIGGSGSAHKNRGSLCLRNLFFGGREVYIMGYKSIIKGLCDF